MVVVRKRWTAARRKAPVPRTMGLDDEFPYGRHMNRTVQWVIENNPSYLSWTLREFKDFYITEEARYLLNEARKKPGYKEMTPQEFYRKEYKQITTAG